MANEQLLGYWWRPGENAFAGNLDLDEAGNIGLTILANGLTPSDFEYQEIIYGVTGQERYTLVGLMPHRTNYAMGSAIGTTKSYFVQTAIKGVHLETYDHPFARFSFSLDGLQDWTQLTGIKKEILQSDTSKRWERVYTQKSPDSVELQIQDITIRFIPTTREHSPKWTIDLKESTQIHVSGDARTSHDWMREVVRPIQRLVQFSIKTGGNLQRLAASDKQDDPDGRDSELDWFNIINFDSGKYPYEPQGGFEQPVTVMMDFTEQPQIMEAWLELFGKLREPIGAVIDTELGEPTLEYVLFVHSRLLERLVSRYPSARLIERPIMRKISKYARELVDESIREQVGQKLPETLRADARVPLKHSLKRWLPMLGDWNATEEELDWIATKIVKTRNRFAHQEDGVLDPKQIQPSEFHIFLGLVQALIELEIADSIGLSTELVVKRRSDSLQWRNARIVRQVWNDIQAESDDSQSSA